VARLPGSSRRLQREGRRFESVTAHQRNRLRCKALFQNFKRRFDRLVQQGRTGEAQGVDSDSFTRAALYKQ
jgi:hypothetical protein